MQLTIAHRYGSIEPEEAPLDLPDLVVLSGPNGSGKTHFLEAIQTGHILVDRPSPRLSPFRREEDSHPKPNSDVRLFAFGALQATGGRITSETTTQGWQTFVQSVQAAEAAAQQRSPTRASYDGLGAIGTMAAGAIRRDGLIAASAISEMEKRAGKKLPELTIKDLAVWAPPISKEHDAFVSSIAQVFVNYQERLDRHGHRQWLHEKGRIDKKDYWTEEEFRGLFGPPPWEVLSRALDIIGLPYRFRGPDNWEETKRYELKLVDEGRGAEVLVERLSTGERTLLALGLSLYASEAGEQSLTLPRLLLLDEPDASLHPSMASDFLRVVRDLLITERGVKVILTTHSPTTVALAPEESLFQIGRDASPRVFKATKDECLRTLTVGLPTLSVRIENRRQVFCEAQTDAALYERLFALLSQDRQWAFSLEFIAVGHPHGGSEEVKRIVAELRARGNTSIFGIVDRDDKADVRDGVVCNAEFYSIENLILHPLAIGIFLLRERLMAPQDLGLSERSAFYSLSIEEMQLLTGTVEHLVLGESNEDIELALMSGENVRVGREWLDRRGHDLEDLLLEKLPPLRSTNGRLKERVVERAIVDVPSIVPASAAALFESLMAD